ncbi:hypothetical protein BCR43DRAFT_482691 [Syncephalastrum racemosum]|uniref:Uncharacterized protein n=1 Tax=Syncephalastrum racemosum TaxID=13706 RepID=A0A1X2HU58_SYNRA|nr:hypothetical protein BCR43DRAFT_482691 [Syncephalastrum racemosum]
MRFSLTTAFFAALAIIAVCQPAQAKPYTCQNKECNEDCAEQYFKVGSCAPDGRCICTPDKYT